MGGEMASRAAVLKATVAALHSHAPLVSLCGSSSKIFGMDAAKGIPSPGIVVAIGVGEAANPSQEMIDWTLSLFIYADKALTLAAILDALEDCVHNYVGNATINLLRLGAHQTFVLENNSSLIGLEQELTVRFIRS